MIPTINHVYSCTWVPDYYTYFNVVTNVTSNHIYGKCIFSTEPDYFEDNPHDAESIKWKLSNWNEDAPKSVIVDLGHIDDLPELFI